MSVYELRNESYLFANLNSISLLKNYSNCFSECGQDGILSEIFSRLNIDRGFFVEFGSWDGVYLSNCRSLLLKGWSGCSIECDPDKFKLLVKNSPDSVVCINEMVGTSDGKVFGKSLGTILTESRVSLEKVDFVSIDIDGGDLEVFEDLNFTPPVILLEGGFNYNPECTEKVPLDYALRNNQHPLGAVILSAAVKGYSCVCFFQDSYLIRNDLMDKFPEFVGITAKELYKDAWVFASDTLRSHLLNLRDTDSFLKDFEKSCLGVFNLSPYNA